MKNLFKMIEELLSGNQNAAKIYVSNHMSTIAKRHINEDAQADMFGDNDEKQQTKYRFLVKPIGVSYDNKEHAISAAKNHPKKSVSVVDTETDEVVYSHSGKKSKS